MTMELDGGRVASDQALVSDQAPAGLDASRFDPSRDRGIVVGKSWPRPATECDLVPRWEGEFRNHADWVNFASKRLTVATDSNGNDLKAICVDTLGRRCANGRDMARARDEGTFPVRYFWDCWPASAMSARRAETEGLSPQDASVVGESRDAQPSGSEPI